MTSRLQAHILPGGRRLHLQDGPIDLIIEAWGEADAIHAAYRAASRAMEGVLDSLCAELPVLRGRRAGAVSAAGRRMQNAVAPYAAETFITPMAAVAGAVAEEVLQAMTRAADLARAYVNNGGDIALHLAAAERLVLGAVDRPDRPSLFAASVIEASSNIRGIATSGWRGRSFSLGIADAVTVLAASAAAADAAATVIANAVDCPDLPGIVRVAANMLDPMSDLGERRVTRDVPILSERDRVAALERGARVAERLLEAGRIGGAALHVQGTTRAVGASAPARRLMHV